MTTLNLTPTEVAHLSLALKEAEQHAGPSVGDLVDCWTALRMKLDTTLRVSNRAQVSR